jgi:hypothetical protein
MATGESWRAQRNAAHAFTAKPTLAYFADHTLQTNLGVLLDPLTEACETGQVVDFHEVALDYTLAVFGEIAFDVSRLVSIWHYRLV